MGYWHGGLKYMSLGKLLWFSFEKWLIETGVLYYESYSESSWSSKNAYIIVKSDYEDIVSRLESAIDYNKPPFEILVDGSDDGRCARITIITHSSYRFNINRNSDMRNVPSPFDAFTIPTKRWLGRPNQADNERLINNTELSIATPYYIASQMIGAFVSCMKEITSELSRRFENNNNYEQLQRVIEPLNSGASIALPTHCYKYLFEQRWSPNAKDVDVILNANGLRCEAVQRESDTILSIVGEFDTKLIENFFKLAQSKDEGSRELVINGFDETLVEYAINPYLKTLLSQKKE